MRSIGLLSCFLWVVSSIGVVADQQSEIAACERDPVFEWLEAQSDLLSLGRDLFYDPILSGNGTVACATCHHPAFGTSDAVALSIGDGGVGIGPKRRVDPQNPPEQRIPRNAQALFNLGYDEFSTLFHDGRVERLGNGQIRTPFGTVREIGPLAVLAAQAAFPVLSPDEMAGHYSENPVAQAVRRGLFRGPGGAYEVISARVEEIDAYRLRFAALGGSDTQLDYDQIARALAAFIAHEWRADESPFDAYLCDGAPLSRQAKAGMELFYGRAGCANCHAGRFQTDHSFHAIAMVQIGPGKAERFETHASDLGRERVTGRTEDAYRFRTPSLRNVALTGPYGHAGAYPDLESVVRHHLDPVGALSKFPQECVVLPHLQGALDFTVLDSPEDVAAIVGANDLVTVQLTEAEIADLLAFLSALTDQRGVTGRLGVPEAVPSGLPVPRP